MTSLSENPVRWGILGASKFAREYMAPAIHMADGAVLAAIATSDPAKAAPFQAFQPNLRVMTDYEALLADPDIDAIYIPLPNHLHLEWTLKALDAGKPVLTEKPIALEEADFDQLIEARDRSGLLAAEAYMVVHHPQWQRVRQLLAEGAVGKLQHVRGVFCYNNAASPDNIRNRPETAGGAIRDIGVYPFGVTRFVTGQEPSTVKADISWENDVDVISRVSAQFPDFSFECVVTMRMHLFQEMSFHGDRGVIRLAAPFNAQVFKEASIELMGGEDTRLIRYPDVNHYVHQVENFGAALRGEMDYPVPLEFSRGTQRMIDMAFAAAGRPGGNTRVDHA